MSASLMAAMAAENHHTIVASDTLLYLYHNCGAEAEPFRLSETHLLAIHTLEMLTKGGY